MPLSAAEQQQFNQAFAKAIAEDHPVAHAKAISPAEAKKYFCDHYNEVMMVLGVLQELITNSIAKLAITAVIKAVETLHSVICK